MEDKKLNEEQKVFVDKIGEDERLVINIKDRYNANNHKAISKELTRIGIKNKPLIFFSGINGDQIELYKISNKKES